MHVKNPFYAQFYKNALDDNPIPKENVRWVVKFNGKIKCPSNNNKLEVPLEYEFFLELHRIILLIYTNNNNNPIFLPRK